MVTSVEALAFPLQATRLCAGGKTVLEPVAVITRDCSNMWHVLKVQVIPYYMGLRDHGMEDRRMQLLLLEKPDCHPVSLSEKDHFMPLFEALSAGPPLTGKALPEVRLAFCHFAALSLGVPHLCAMPELSKVRPASFAVHVPLCRGDAPVRKAESRSNLCCSSALHLPQVGTVLVLASPAGHVYKRHHAAANIPPCRLVSMRIRLRMRWP